ncbi:MAG: tetratricopeptide repeat protein [Deltaproteobacteria bacterium]|nr:tetratricopeptide repeat protein [Deltaproteobacteria bacterium]
MRRYFNEFIVGLILVVATLTVYRQVTDYEFVNVDDDVYITANRHVQAGWTGEGLKWAFTTNLHGHWHPLTWLSHMTDAQLFGLNPAGHHLTNLFLHLANTLLLFLLMRRMTGAVYRSAAVAALFALHPLHVESVVWVADRKDVLAGLFFLLTLWVYVSYIRRRTFVRYLPALACFGLALLCKSAIATLPAILLLLDYWPLARLEPPTNTQNQHVEPGGSGRVRQALLLLWEKSGFFIIVAIAAVVTFKVMESVITGHKPLSEWWAADALINYVAYMGKLFWPVNMTVFYPYIMKVPLWKIWGSASILVLISILAVLWARKRPYVIVGWLWYLLTLVPVIGVIRAGPHKLADRYTYLPLIGLFIIMAWGVSELLGRWRFRRQGLAVICGLVMVAMIVGSWHQARYWKDSISLFSHAVSIHPQSWLALNNLGDAMAEKGDTDKAMELFKRALRVNPAYAKTHYNLAKALFESGDPEGAVASYREAIRPQPDYARAHHNLGVILARQGNHGAAVEQFSEALGLDAEYLLAYRNLGEALEKLDRQAEAVDAYEALLGLEPGDAALHNQVGMILTRLGRVDEAMAHYEAALRLRPDLAEAHNNIGVLLAQQNRIKKAAGHFREALRYDPHLEGARKNLERAQGMLDSN